MSPTTNTSHPDVVFGAAPFASVEDNPNAKFRTIEAAKPIFDYLQEVGLTQLDSSRHYPPGSDGENELFLGAHGVPGWATIDTKVRSRPAGAHRAAEVTRSIDESLAALHVTHVNILYLHFPDRSVPFAETLRAVDEAHRAGKFARFGVSNYTAAEVAEMLAICEREGFVKPSVYQGQYNAVFRGGEKELFPLLRKHGISFYAYSPSAAGMFTGKITRESVNVEGSRWDKSTSLGEVYRKNYFKDSVFEAASRVHQASSELGLDGHSVALRWVLHHSVLKKEYGDKVILGVSSLDQLKSNWEAVNAGPLPESLVRAIDEVWPLVADENAVYHF